MPMGEVRVVDVTRVTSGRATSAVSGARSTADRWDISIGDSAVGVRCNARERVDACFSIIFAVSGSAKHMGSVVENGGVLHGIRAPAGRDSKALMYPPPRIDVTTARKAVEDIEDAPGDRAIRAVFNDLPGHDLESVRVKCQLLNVFAGANNRWVDHTAKAWSARARTIDDRFAAGDLSIVEELAKVGAPNKSLLSAASKYASYSAPRYYPIYDSWNRIYIFALVENARKQKLEWFHERPRLTELLAKHPVADVNALMEYPVYSAWLTFWAETFGLNGEYWTPRRTDAAFWSTARRAAVPARKGDRFYSRPRSD